MCGCVGVCGCVCVCVLKHVCVIQSLSPLQLVVLFRRTLERQNEAMELANKTLQSQLDWAKTVSKSPPVSLC